MRTALVIGLSPSAMPGLATAQGRMATEVVRLGFRPLEEILPVLRDLVPPPGVVTGMQNQLIIKAPAADMPELLALVRSLDRAPQNLLIRVRHELDEEVRRDLASATLSASTGRLRGTVGGGAASGGIGSRSQDTGVRLSGGVSSSRTVTSARDDQRLRVLEGRQAFINTGQSVPYRETVTVQGANRITTTTGTAFREVGTGFYVRPRLVDNGVQLEISTHRDRLAGASTGGRINVSETSNFVTGALGRWIELAQSTGSRSSTGTSIGSTGSASRSSSRAVYVKVELVR